MGNSCRQVRPANHASPCRIPTALRRIRKPGPSLSLATCKGSFGPADDRRTQLPATMRSDESGKLRHKPLGREIFHTLSEAVRLAENA